MKSENNIPDFTLSNVLGSTHVYLNQLQFPFPIALVKFNWEEYFHWFDLCIRIRGLILSRIYWPQFTIPKTLQRSQQSRCNSLYEYDLVANVKNHDVLVFE